MLFHAHKHAMSFELGGLHYEGPLGSTFDIPDRVAFCVEAHGLPLAKGKGSADRAVIVGRKREVHHAPSLVTPVSKVDAAEELADVTGEDPIEPGGDLDSLDESDDAAERALKQLDDQGIRVPGKRPGRKSQR